MQTTSRHTHQKWIHTPQHNPITLPCDTEFDFCVGGEGVRWLERDTSRGEGFKIADARLDVSCSTSDYHQHAAREEVSL